MTPAAREARERVLKEWPWAEFAGYTENGKPGFLLWDGVQFDASGYLGFGDTIDAA